MIMVAVAVLAALALCQQWQWQWRCQCPAPWGCQCSLNSLKAAPYLRVLRLLLRGRWRQQVEEQHQVQHFCGDSDMCAPHYFKPWQVAPTMTVTVTTAGTSTSMLSANAMVSMGLQHRLLVWPWQCQWRQWRQRQQLWQPQWLQWRQQQQR
jgi:hypothetical protein